MMSLSAMGLFRVELAGSGEENGAEKQKRPVGKMLAGRDCVKRGRVRSARPGHL